MSGSTGSFPLALPVANWDLFLYSQFHLNILLHSCCIPCPPSAGGGGCHEAADVTWTAEHGTWLSTASNSLGCSTTSAGFTGLATLRREGFYQPTNDIFHCCNAIWARWAVGWLGCPLLLPSAYGLEPSRLFCREWGTTPQLHRNLKPPLRLAATGPA